MLPNLKKCPLCKGNHRLISAFKRCAKRNAPKATWKLSDAGIKLPTKKRKSNNPKINKRE